MKKIKNMGSTTAKFNEGLIIDGTAGDDIYSLVVSGSIIAPSITGSITNAESDIMGNKIVGGVFEIDQGLFQNPTYNPVFFPSDDTFLERTAPTSINYSMAPFNGELIKVQIKTSTSFSGTSLTCSFHKGSGNDNAYNSSPSASVSLNGKGANEMYTFDFMGNQGSLFSEGDIYGFSLEVNGGFAGNENIHFTTTVRYNPYS